MIQKWSLKSLAELVVSHDGAQRTVRDVTARLARQVAFCHDHLAPRVQHNTKLTKDLDHLMYIHEDTHRLCQQLETQSTLYDRWNRADQRLVSSTLAQVRNRHASIERWIDMVNADRALHDDVTKILRARLGIQLLCDHAVQQLDRDKPHGAVTVDCSIPDCIDDAYTEARFLCDAHWQVSPELVFDATPTKWSDARVTCIRPWLTHALVELFKNAMETSVCDLDVASGTLPQPIQVSITENEAHVRIDVTDQGKGLGDFTPDDIETRLFGLGVSSADKKWDRLDEQQSYAMVRSPLSSLGVGLPVSRMMIEHFGGNVLLQNAANGSGAMASIMLPKDVTILEREP